MRRLLTLLATVMVLVGLVAAPAVADPQGFIEDELYEYGFFYGTFDQSPNVALFAGGRIEEFCDGDPGVTTSRKFVRRDGSVDVKVNAKDQLIYLYTTEFNDIVDWLVEICPGIGDGDNPPTPFASGTANLKVRDSYLPEDGPPERLSNSVNGRATGLDGTRYIVRGQADIPFEYGAPVGTPPDWVSFELREIGR